MHAALCTHIQSCLPAMHGFVSSSMPLHALEMPPASHKCTLLLLSHPAAALSMVTVLQAEVGEGQSKVAALERDNTAMREQQTLDFERICQLDEETQRLQVGMLLGSCLLFDCCVHPWLE